MPQSKTLKIRRFTQIACAKSIILPSEKPYFFLIITTYFWPRFFSCPVSTHARFCLASSGGRTLPFSCPPDGTRPFAPFNMTSWHSPRREFAPLANPGSNWLVLWAITATMSRCVLHSATFILRHIKL